MTREEALKIVLAKQQNKLLFGRLLAWDEKRTLEENAVAGQMYEGQARNLVSRYGLKFAVGTRAMRRSYKRPSANFYRENWDPNKTIDENADNLNIGYHKAVQIKNNYQLEFTKTYVDGTRARHMSKLNERISGMRETFQALREKGVTLDKIGQLYGMTRERVRQILL